MLCLTVCLLIFGKGVARWSDRTVAVRAEAGAEETDITRVPDPAGEGRTGRTGRMQRQYELLKEQESAAAAALREAEAQMMEEKIPEEDGERQAEAADLQEELHNIRLQERVLEARILETGG